MVAVLVSTAQLLYIRNSQHCDNQCHRVMPRCSITGLAHLDSCQWQHEIYVAVAGRKRTFDTRRHGRCGFR